MKKSFLKISGIRIPQITIGQGRPRLLITAGIHGDEHSQQLVLRRILARPPRINRGSLVILPRVNPHGLLRNSEVNPADGLNINRVFPGNTVSHQQSRRIAAAVFVLARQSEVVIDLHNFTDPALSQLIFVESGLSAVRRQSKKLCQLTGLSLVWRIQPNDSAMPGVDGTLVYNSVQSGIPAIGMELPPAEYMRQRQINVAESGLRRIIACWLSGRRSCPPKHPLIMIKRLNITAPRNGIFQPIAPLGGRLKKVEIIARILREKFHDVIIQSPQAGLLTRISRPGPVVKRQLICNLGIFVNKKH